MGLCKHLISIFIIAAGIDDMAQEFVDKVMYRNEANEDGPGAPGDMEMLDLIEGDFPARFDYSSKLN